MDWPFLVRMGEWAGDDKPAPARLGDMDEGISVDVSAPVKS